MLKLQKTWQFVPLSEAPTLWLTPETQLRRAFPDLPSQSMTFYSVLICWLILNELFVISMLPR
jgi:hypothetical protein